MVSVRVMRTLSSPKSEKRSALSSPRRAPVSASRNKEHEEFGIAVLGGREQLHDLGAGGR